MSNDGYEDGEYYWLLPKGDKPEWEVGKCEKIHRLGFQPAGYQFRCADSGYLTPDDCAEIRKIERPE